MGFLEVGVPLSWKDSEKHRASIKDHGITQLLHVYNLNKDRLDTDLLWGDEVEFWMVKMNDEELSTKCYLGAPNVLEELEVREHLKAKEERTLAADWHPEFGAHMIEAIPFPPMGADLDSILSLEPSMLLRRAKIQAVLPEQCYVTSMAAYPRFGLPGFTDFAPRRDTSCSGSEFIPDELINPHPRFRTLVANIRSRRQAKPAILIPLYKDVNTDKRSMWDLAMDRSVMDRFKIEELSRKTQNPVKDHIYMDCFAFGMGMSCIQATYAAPNICSARYLYDQFVVLAPIFLALTAATPALRGLLADTDTRWSTLEQAVDCRTAEEETGSVPKSRYSAASLYIGACEPLKSNLGTYNDTHPPLNEAVKKRLVDEGMDEVLATHFAHLWIRDPMVIFGDRTELRLDSTEHFENIQSTNWNSVRFKPPPPTSKDQRSPVPWRVEFRTPEAQLSDFDNAAVVAILTVLTHMILKERLDLYIPMSKNDSNMFESWKRDAVCTGKFWFRHDVSHNPTTREYSQMTLDEIMSGSSRVNFPGIMTLCEKFMDQELAAGKVSRAAAGKFRSYTKLFRARASGEVLTTAAFLRKFITAHPDYRQDSVVSEKIAHDVCALAVNMGFGLWTSSALHGELTEELLTIPLPAGAVAPTFSAYAPLPPQRSDSSVVVESLKTVEKGGSQRARVELSAAKNLSRDNRILAPGGSFVINVRDAHLMDEIRDIYRGPSSALEGVSSRATLVPDEAFTWLRVQREIELGCTEASEEQAGVGVADDVSPLSESFSGDSSNTAALRKILERACLDPVSSEDFTRCWLMKGGFEADVRESGRLGCAYREEDGETHLSTTCPASGPASAAGEDLLDPALVDQINMVYEHSA